MPTHICKLLLVPDIRIIVDDSAFGEECDANRMDTVLVAKHGLDGLCVVSAQRQSADQDNWNVWARAGQGTFAAPRAKGAGTPRQAWCPRVRVRST